MAGRGHVKGTNGKPLGSVTVRTRMVANRLMNDPEPTPLEIMVECARFFDRHAKAAEREYEEEQKPVKKRALFRRVAGLKAAALDAADKAAPYMHAKIASTRPPADGEDRRPLLVIMGPGDKLL